MAIQENLVEASLISSQLKKQFIAKAGFQLTWRDLTIKNVGSTLVNNGVQGETGL